MKSKANIGVLNRVFVHILVLTVCSGVSLKSQTSIGEDTDKTLSPYFFVLGENTETDQLPLKSTLANVDISGVIANVKVTQVYKNEGKEALEAVYIFPASTRAAVYDMKMTIGERTIQAIVMEREQARMDYERAKKEGKSASLLEQQRPNVFQMNVANIMPGDEVKVELFYTEMVVPEKGVYEFVYPTVVGPRYSNKTETTATEDDKWVANPYTTEGKKPLYTFNLQVNLNAGMPLKDVSCSSHETDISYNGASSATIKLKKGNEFEGNRDFTLKYRLQGDQIQSGLLLYQGKDENFFLAMVQPPRRVTPQQIPPREYVFVMDVSGSMNGFPIETSKALMHDLLKNLRPTDKFNVVLFAGASALLSEASLNVNEENLQKAIKLIDKQEGGGGTEIVPALEKALALKGTHGYARTFVIATDGYVDVEKKTFDLIRNNLGKASFFAFGIGTAVNRYIIEGMAHVGQGEPFIVEKADKAEAVARKFREYVQTPVLTNLKVSFEGFYVYEAEPLAVPSLYVDRPLLIYGKYKGQPSGKINLAGITGEGTFSKTIDVGVSKPTEANIALKYLWARNRIMLLDDYGKVPGDFESVKKEVLALGLKYNLLTAYTSFIAIDSDVRNNTGKSVTVKQPLPLPEGVNNNAVGFIAGNKTFGSVARRSPMKVMNAPQTETFFESKKEEVDEDRTWTTVEEPATFQGGDIVAFQKWIQESLKYPVVDGSVYGKVYVQFTVNEEGEIEDIKILRGVDPLLDNEVIRVLKTSPRWQPARQNGKTVKQLFTIPVEFKLN
jgi:Ca-activated chloride channel family protein